MYIQALPYLIHQPRTKPHFPKPFSFLPPKKPILQPKLASYMHKYLPHYPPINKPSITTTTTITILLKRATRTSAKEENVRLCFQYTTSNTQHTRNTAISPTHPTIHQIETCQYFRNGPSEQLMDRWMMPRAKQRSRK